MTQPIGVLLVNLGTPEAPRTPEVRRYLREFLSDPRVIDLPAPLRRTLLELVILPRRPRNSAHAYAKIWTEEGSPLWAHSQALTTGVATSLGHDRDTPTVQLNEAPPRWHVRLAMRYGNPSIDSALDELIRAGCHRIVVVPLYPQYASSTTGSTLEAVYRACAKMWNTPSLAVVPPFFADPGFIAAAAGVAAPTVHDPLCEHVVMSFHGLPVRHIRKGDPAGTYCLASDTCCAQLNPSNAACYRAQCFATARALAQDLGLPHERYTVSFQSRLGRDPWIEPYTSDTLANLRRQGIKRIAVMCPAFVADCLETLEEIGIAAREQWIAEGGDDLQLIPCVNAAPQWIEAMVGLVRTAAGAPIPSRPTVQGS